MSTAFSSSRRVWPGQSRWSGSRERRDLPGIQALETPVCGKPDILGWRVTPAAWNLLAGKYAVVILDDTDLDAGASAVAAYEHISCLGRCRDPAAQPWQRGWPVAIPLHVIRPRYLVAYLACDPVEFAAEQPIEPRPPVALRARQVIPPLRAGHRGQQRVQLRNGRED